MRQIKEPTMRSPIVAQGGDEYEKKSRRGPVTHKKKATSKKKTGNGRDRNDREQKDKDGDSKSDKD
jgi:hypothetical protein